MSDKREKLLVFYTFDYENHFFFKFEQVLQSANLISTTEDTKTVGDQFKKYIYKITEMNYLSFFIYFFLSTPLYIYISISGKYPWERYEPSYPPSYGLNSTTIVLLGEWLWY